MKIGVDLDGVLNFVRNHNTGTRFVWWFLLWLPFVKPNKKMIQFLKKWENRAEIIIVSARPRRLERLTGRWLKRYDVPFHQLCLVGLGKGVAERKLKIIRDLDIDIFIDDDPAIVKYLLENGVRAILGAAGKFLAAPFNFCKKAKR